VEGSTHGEQQAFSRGKFGIDRSRQRNRRAAALNLIQAGAGLSLADIDESSLKRTDRRSCRERCAEAADSKRPMFPRRPSAILVDNTLARFGRIDFLVTSAGILRRTQFAEWRFSRVGPDDGRQPAAGRSVAVGRGPDQMMKQRGRGHRECRLAGGADRKRPGRSPLHRRQARCGGVGRAISPGSWAPANIRVNAFCPGRPSPHGAARHAARGTDAIAGGMPIRRWIQTGGAGSGDRLSAERGFEFHHRGLQSIPTAEP